MRRRVAGITVWITGATLIVSAQLSLGDSSKAESRPGQGQRSHSDQAPSDQGIVAWWRFMPDQETADNSGHGHELRLRGVARIVSGGVTDNCLECFSTLSNPERGNGAVVKNDPRLSPKGPFTLELWIKPKPELDSCSVAFLLDKKYLHYPRETPEANRDYCLYLRRTESGKFRLVAYLGFGQDSAEFISQEVTLQPGRWVHLAFTYDGAGVGRFFLNQQPIGRTVHPGRGPIAAGKYDLVIGDRYGSLYSGFPGYIDEVRILAAIPEWAQSGLEIELAPLARTAFLRMEQGAFVNLVLRNETQRDVDGVKIACTFADSKSALQVPKLSPRDEIPLKVPVDTRLRAGTYILRVQLEANQESGIPRKEWDFNVSIVPRPIPGTMPVVLWGTGDLERVKEIGFTHQLVSLADYSHLWKLEKPGTAVGSSQLAEMAQMLNQYLAQGVGAIVSLSPGSWIVRNPETQSRFLRVDRNGQPYKELNPCGLFPEVREFCYRVGASVSETFRDFPALQAALIHTEVRDSTNLCFHKHDLDAFRDRYGFEIPNQATSKWGVRYDRISGFPEDRVIQDSDPLLAFYRWFWTEGDGWNALHSAVHRGLKSARPDLWTFFDPAVRAPSIWGSGGEVDVLSQWTYTYPDPIKIGQAADELFAMAEGRPGQQVMKMTQIIWYRSQTAPKLPEDESQRAPWERENPDAKFITIAPDHLREAFWCKIARPIRGIMYHGWNSLVPAPHASYRFTNPYTKEVLQELIHTVVRPLGPTLLEIPDSPADMAVLESFASQMFAGRGTYGWSRGWEADLHLALQWARFQPRIIYEETVLRDGLDNYRVLVLPSCDVLPASVVKVIKEFQSRGGLVVGDEFLCPAIQPDIRIQSYRRTGKAQEDKAALQRIAATLRQELASRYPRRADSSDPDVIVRTRQYRGTLYVFTINDRRTFGDYVGHHGLVMEQGLPLEGSVSVVTQGKTVYDLVEHHTVESQRTGEALTWSVKLGPGEGRLFMVTEQAINKVEVSVPEKSERGQSVSLIIRVLDENGAPLSAVIPIELEMTDSQGRTAEPTGFYAARDGVLHVAMDFARNDSPGEWQIRVRELAAGHEVFAKMILQ
ncbi:LamG-like jellyroll fold domain-containing protein [Thermogutta sp.]|uniref:LamG domain-containing protein n=1 Tax=Thermogutta sp. TaxID=1962930 RepID=UPI00322065EA